MKIAVANHALTGIEAVCQAISLVPELQVIWVASDGYEAVERAAKDTPDLILMDLQMPSLDGVEATRRIMAGSPCAVIIVTAEVDRNSSKVFEAMGAGALDVVSTPTGFAQNGLQIDALLAKIETIRRLLGQSHPRISDTSMTPRVRTAQELQTWLVAIGASAGGPLALATVLGQLPTSFPAAVVVAQHVDADFVPGLVSWLGSRSALPVRSATDGESPEPGAILLAGRDDHLVFTAPNCLNYTRAPEDCAYRPSVDVLFRSALRHWPGKIAAVLLTGMGRDGAEGLLLLKQKGYYTIAQDESSSAVYGMPKAASELGAASEVLALHQIASHLGTAVAGGDLSFTSPAHRINCRS